MDMFVNRRDLYGNTPLYLAASKEHLGICKLLLDAGAFVDVTSENGLTSLQGAAYTNKLDVVEILLDGGADVNNHSFGHPSALHMAVMEDNVEIAEALIKAGAKVDQKNHKGENPLWVAIRKKLEQMMTLLLENGSNPLFQMKSGEGLLHAAIELEDLEVFFLIMETAVIRYKNFTYADLINFPAHSKNDETPFHYAVKYKSADAVFFFLGHGANVMQLTKDGMNSLHLAVLSGDEEIVSIIIEAMAGFANGKELLVNTAMRETGHTPLHLAVKRNNSPIAKFLLEHGANVLARSTDGLTAFQYAVMNNNCTTVNMILEHGQQISDFQSSFVVADWFVNSVAHNNRGETTLHYAVVNCSPELVWRLLDVGGDPHLVTKAGETVFQLAENPGTVSYLIQYGLQLDRLLTGGFTELHRAVKMQSLDVIKKLKKASATIDVCDTEGRTPLYWAVQEESRDIVELLLTYGANPHLITEADDSAYELAHRENLFLDLFELPVGGNETA